MRLSCGAEGPCVIFLVALRGTPMSTYTDMDSNPDSVV